MNTAAQQAAAEADRASNTAQQAAAAAQHAAVAAECAAGTAVEQADLRAQTQHQEVMHEVSNFFVNYITY